MRHDAAGHWGLAESPWGGCLAGAWPPHPRPLSPCRGEGRLGCQFSVFSCQSGHAFSFAASRLRVRHNAAEHWGLAESPWGGCWGVPGSLTHEPSHPAGARGDWVASFQFSVARWNTHFPSRLRGFAASRLRVRHDADKHWGLVEWPRGRCLGAWPPHPRPLSPCGGEGRLGCQFSVFSCESGHAFSFASSRLRVRHDAAEHWGLAEWPWGRCLGVFGSLTPDPSPPAGARGD